MAGSEMTGEEAAAALKAGVEALFAEARSAEPHERTVFVRAGAGHTPYVYVAFAYGRKRIEHREGTLPLPIPLEQLVSSTIAAVAAEFPDHASQQMIWRVEPEHERREAAEASRVLETPPYPEHDALYCRLVALPMGRKTDCPICGMPHEAAEPHFLTEQAVELILTNDIGDDQRLYRLPPSLREAFPRWFEARGA